MTYQNMAAVVQETNQMEWAITANNKLAYPSLKLFSLVIHQTKWATKQLGYNHV